MRRIPPIFAIGTATVALMAGGALADDGEMTNKRMTGGSIGNQLTVLPEEVGAELSEPEHAYTQFMPFYVPAQRASGLQEPIEYNNIDLAPVETLSVARPLINVFIYGPLHEVEGTAFAYSWMDAFAAVSLDDGETWKTTNLSESADQSSFELSADGGGSGHGHDSDDEGNHGAGLSIDLDGAYWTVQNKNFGKLQVLGDGDPKEKVSIINFDTGERLFTATADNKTGEFDVTKNVRVTKAPCRVAAVASGETSSPIPVQYPEDSEIACEGLDIADYPGGVSNIVHAVAGNRVLVAWPSRFCSQGSPGYSFAWRGEDKEPDIKQELIDRRDALIEHLGVDIHSDLYLTDLFGVAGNQGSSNFEEEGYPQVGEVPFSCLWTVRGVLNVGDDPRTEETEAAHMVWMKPERLTSGRRDVNRVEVDGKQGVGFSVVWQEDPEGLRPGQGEGPGEGWSGAIAHPKTDTWYSFIPWDQFAWVENADDPLVKEDVFAYILPGGEGASANASGRPQPYVPMALPVRLTNNDKCVPDKFKPGVEDEEFGYCNGDVAALYGLQDFCADTVEVPQGKDGEPGEICVNTDGLPNLANTASTRARFSLQAYDDPDLGRKSGWIILAVEESKGLGRFTFLPDGKDCELPPPGTHDDTVNPDCTADIGKNQWYHSFDMGRVKSSEYMDHDNSLVQNLVSQGNMLNQPEVDWREGEFYPVINTERMWDFGAYNFDLYNTEIARRSSLLVQPVAKAVASANGLAAFSTWKQGAMRQGGPADTMARRIVVPAGFEQGLNNNPYSFANMECAYPEGFVPPAGQEDPWLYKDGSNPYYPDGLCIAPAINLSAVIPDTCWDTDTDGVADCPVVDFTDSPYGIGNTNPILQGYLQGEGNTTKVLTWHQCPADVDSVVASDGIEAVACDADTRDDDPFKSSMTDQSWYNPLDVSKGHRGFIDGDFVMFMYAWSPNWRLNAKGSDRYDLYVRRSFDGGRTWTTTPVHDPANPEPTLASDGISFDGDGTTSCQIFRSSDTQIGGETLEPVACYTYAAGAAEAARNLTQHKGQRVTTLDPRFTPTGGGLQVSIVEGCTDGLDKADGTPLSPEGWACADASAVQSEDLRDPSRYFIVYETGDNSTVEEGEAEPLDLFYARAENFGDHYTVWTEIDTGFSTLADCYPNNPYDDDKVIGTPIEGSGFCNEFDRMTTGNNVEASESSLTATPAGGKLYGVWTQIEADNAGNVEDANAMARRVWWLDNYISADESYTLPGTNKPE